MLIPFSIEWEQKLWATRDDPDGRAAFLDGSGGAASALPKMVVQVRAGQCTGNRVPVRGMLHASVPAVLRRCAGDGA